VDFLYPQNLNDLARYACNYERLCPVAIGRFFAGSAGLTSALLEGLHAVKASYLAVPSHW